MSKSDKTGKTGSYVYTMNRVGKVVPPKREILKDISLSFFPGAKIGVLGLNGAGKGVRSLRRTGCRFRRPGQEAGRAGGLHPGHRWPRY